MAEADHAAGRSTCAGSAIRPMVARYCDGGIAPR
jgi:hypothetical protein